MSRTFRTLSITFVLIACLFVTVSSWASNLVLNGDFSAGNTGFSSAYVFTNSTIPPQTYDVTTNPQNAHPLWASFGDHTTGTGNMMVVNGATVADQLVWGQNVTVIPNTNYTFSAWVASVYPQSPAVLAFNINGSQIGSNFTASSTTGLWQQFLFTWNSGSSTTASLSIFDQNLDFSGNDFALDDISLSTATPEPASMTLLLAGCGALAWLRRRK